MTKLNRGAVLTAVAIAMTATSSFAQTAPAAGMHMFAALDLTDQQRAKIARIVEDARKKNWDAIGKVIDESATLRELYSAPTHDAAAIGLGFNRWLQQIG